MSWLRLRSLGLTASHNVLETFAEHSLDANLDRKQRCL